MRLETAERFCAYVHGALVYAHGKTSVTTTAAQALACGSGVCQDYAHLMIALCRAVGLPVRYVSGHLLGEGGTHAWVEVVVAGSPGRPRGGVGPVQRPAGREGIRDRGHRPRLRRRGANLGHVYGDGARNADHDQAGWRSPGRLS